MITELKCENCKREFKLDMSKTGKGKSIPCPHCKAKYVFEDNNIRDVNKKLDRLLKDIKINIRL